MIMPSNYRDLYHPREYMEYELVFNMQAENNIGMLRTAAEPTILVLRDFAFNWWMM